MVKVKFEKVDSSKGRQLIPDSPKSSDNFWDKYYFNFIGGLITGTLFIVIPYLLFL